MFGAQDAGRWAWEANVELAASGYLYTIAVIATTFASFSALTMIFRQMLGGQMTKFDSFIIRTFVQLGFMATLGSILPPLLALFEIPSVVDWRAFACETTRRSMLRQYVARTKRASEVASASAQRT